MALRQSRAVSPRNVVEGPSTLDAVLLLAVVCRLAVVALAVAPALAYPLRRPWRLIGRYRVTL